MITEELYFWRIEWAGTWMTTHKRLTRQAVQVEHPEAVPVVFEAAVPPHEPVQDLLAAVAKGRMAEVVSQGDGLGVLLLRAVRHIDTHSVKAGVQHCLDSDSLI